jgi:Mn2+/Fe2+ NRAMP family transporter
VKNKPAFRFHNFKNVLKFLGPGLITGASDDDPSGIATYSQAGAGFGLGMLWLAIFQYPFFLKPSPNNFRSKLKSPPLSQIGIQ